MTDNEIIKALECCMKDGGSCPQCPLEGKDYCRVDLAEYSFDLIKRQKAEAERLQEALDGETTENMRLKHEIEGLESRIFALNDTNKMLMDSQEVYWKNRVKEFGEKLKTIMCNNSCYFHKPITISIIDNLVKEMTEVRE